METQIVESGATSISVVEFTVTMEQRSTAFRSWVVLVHHFYVGVTLVSGDVASCKAFVWSDILIVFC